MCLSDDSLTSFVSSSPGANASTVRRWEGLGEELPRWWRGEDTERAKPRWWRGEDTERAKPRLRRGEDTERAKRVSVRLQTEGKALASKAGCSAMFCPCRATT